MATSYGVVVANKFAIASDDDDEYDDPRYLVQKVASIAAKKKEENVVKQTVKETVPVAVVKTDNVRGRGARGRGRGGAAGRPRDGENTTADKADRFGENRRGGLRRGGDRGEHRSERGERGAPRTGGRGGRGGFGGNRNANQSGEESKEVTFEEHGETDRPRRRGGFTLGGAPGGRGGGRGGRGRQFDRQSGSDRTGVRSFDKKDGHGKGNWGDQKQDELAGETENIAPDAENVEPEVPREKTAEELAREAEEAELAKQKTLKEFRAQQTAEAPKFNTRKAGEGAADNFGKLVPIKKEVIPDREEDEVVVIHKAPRKQVIDISITFAEQNRGGFRNNDRNDRSDRTDRNDRERGDRPQRGGRGGRAGGSSGRGGARGGNRSAPFDSSTEAFPALGAH